VGSIRRNSPNRLALSSPTNGHAEPCEPGHDGHLAIDQPGTLQNPSPLFQAGDPTALHDTNSWPTYISIIQHTDAGFSALPIETSFEPTPEMLPLDFYLPDSIAQTAHQSQGAHPNPVMRHPTASHADNIPSLEITTASQPMTITSRLRTQRLLLPKESILLHTQSLSPSPLLRSSGPGSSNAAQSNQKFQEGSRKRRLTSPVSRPQRVSKQKNSIPPQMIQCLKLGLPFHSGLQPCEKKKKPCLICHMHKKRVCY